MWWVREAEGRQLAARHWRQGVPLHVGIGKGKALPVHEVAHGRWSGQAAANFYKILARDLAKALPDKRRFAILEDNDPTGFKSAKGIAAKDEVGMGDPKAEPRLVCAGLCYLGGGQQAPAKAGKQVAEWQKRNTYSLS